MKNNTQKIISAVIVGAVSFYCFKALIYLLNLNQTGLFLNVAIWSWLWLGFILFFFYHVHYKKLGGLAMARAKHENMEHRLYKYVKIGLSALAFRWGHLFKWRNLGLFLNYYLSLIHI